MISQLVCRSQACVRRALLLQRAVPADTASPALSWLRRGRRYNEVQRQLQAHKWLSRVCRLDKQDRPGAVEVANARVRAQLVEEKKRREERVQAANRLALSTVLTPRQASTQFPHRFAAATS